jgi:polar amino acid transport system substrate-binding protein
MSARTRRQFLKIAGGVSIALHSPTAWSQTSAVDEIRKRGTIRIGWTIWYPYVFRDPQNNQITGIMPELANAMASSLGVKIEWVEDSTATLIAGLQSNKFDLTTLLGITEQRAQAATFTKPVVQDGTALAGLKSRIAGKSGWEAYNQPGTRISVTLGSNTDLYATKLFTRAEIVRFRTEPESIAAVLASQVDIMAIGRGSSGIVLAQRSELGLVPNSVFQSYPVAPVVRKDNLALRDWLDQFCDEQKRNGSLLKIVEKYGLDRNSIPS